MNIFARIWLQSSSFFDPVQKIFNYSFWTTFEQKFTKYSINKSVLDLACGTGELLNHITPPRYLGLDINNNYIQHASNNYHLPNQAFLLRNICTGPLPPKFQTAFFISAAHHLSDTDLKKLISNIKNSDTEILIIIDGYPKKYFSPLLKFLDHHLAGGKYFRDLDQIKKLVSKDLLTIDSGVFTSKLSCYFYPYIICTTKTKKQQN